MKRIHAKMAACAMGLAGVAALAAGPVAAADYTYLSANLFGGAVPGGGAGERATADFNGEGNLDTGKVCYYFEGYNLGKVTGAHIHRGAEGDTGAEVAALEVGGEDVDEVCMEMDQALLAEIAADPSAFYVDVHTAKFPDGAVRGQLSE